MPGTIQNHEIHNTIMFVDDEVVPRRRSPRLREKLQRRWEAIVKPCSVVLQRLSEQPRVSDEKSNKNA
uniref:Uncharacterized protein n=1 Tax=Trichogramma kaykai TaxID=54128 RepID=A0ABD2WEY1_9HYME